MKTTKTNIYYAPNCKTILLCETAVVCASPEPEVEFGRDGGDVLNW